MQNNEKLLTSLETLGLDLDTGKSPKLGVKDIERVSGIRVTGNGSIIRNDIAPWDKFMITRHKVGRSISAFTFEGYQTVGFKREVIKDRMRNREERMAKEIQAISKDSKELEEISNYREDITLFSKDSLYV